MLSNYRNIAMLTDSAGMAWRQGIGLLGIDSNQVTLVSDTTICRAAVNAYNTAMLPDTLASSAVDVVKYGTTRYVVADSARVGGEWTTNIVFDALFTQVLGKIGQ